MGAMRAAHHPQCRGTTALAHNQFTIIARCRPCRGSAAAEVHPGAAGYVECSRSGGQMDRSFMQVPLPRIGACMFPGASRTTCTLGVPRPTPAAAARCSVRRARRTTLARGEHPCGVAPCNGMPCGCRSALCVLSRGRSAAETAAARSVAEPAAQRRCSLRVMRHGGAGRGACCCCEARRRLHRTRRRRPCASLGVSSSAPRPWPCRWPGPDARGAAARRQHASGDRRTRRGMLSVASARMGPRGRLGEASASSNSAQAEMQQHAGAARSGAAASLRAGAAQHQQGRRRRRRAAVGFCFCGCGRAAQILLLLERCGAKGIEPAQRAAPLLHQHQGP